MSMKQSRQNWLNLLRSNQYKKGKRKYYNIDTQEYCTLGLGILNILQETNQEINRYNISYFSYSELKNYYGIKYGGEISKINDDTDMTLSEIAEYLENDMNSLNPFIFHAIK